VTPYAELHVHWNFSFLDGAFVARGPGRDGRAARAITGWDRLPTAADQSRPREVGAEHVCCGSPNVYSLRPAEGSVDSGNEFCLLAGDRLGKLRVECEAEQVQQVGLGQCPAGSHSGRGWVKAPPRSAECLPVRTTWTFDKPKVFLTGKALPCVYTPDYRSAARNTQASSLD
jgi:hypothetical protein